MKVLNLFPLTVTQDKINVDEHERSLLINEIKNMQLNNSKQESNKIKVCDNFCMYTACIIMAVAVFLQCRTQEATIFNTMLLLLGVNSSFKIKQMGY